MRRYNDALLIRVKFFIIFHNTIVILCNVTDDFSSIVHYTAISTCITKLFVCCSSSWLFVVVIQYNKLKCLFSFGKFHKKNTRFFFFSQFQPHQQQTSSRHFVFLYFIYFFFFSFADFCLFLHRSNFKKHSPVLFF